MMIDYKGFTIETADYAGGCIIILYGRKHVLYLTGMKRGPKMSEDERCARRFRNATFAREAIDQLLKDYAPTSLAWSHISY